MKKLAIDCSSFMWRALTAGTDYENGKTVFFNDKEVTVNSATYGYEIVMGMMVALLKETGHQPVDTLLVFEGKSSKSKRMLLDSTYKGGTGVASHPTESYVEFQALSDRLRTTWKEVGATCLTQDFAEGDDTLAYLAREWPGPLTVATYDNDISALNTEPGETNAYGGTCVVWVGGKVGLNKYGAFDFRRIRVYKALVGDSSDKIKGVSGFGPGAFDKLVMAAGWDGMDELEAMLDAGDLGPLEGLAEETEGKGKPTVLAKLAKLILASSDSVVKAWRVVKLYPEWVQTLRNPLQIVAGKVTSEPKHYDERLAEWYGETHLITQGNYVDAVETVKTLAGQGPFVTLDIETSTSEISDDWLASCNDANGVDTLDSKLTGFSLTFGANLNMNLYVSVNHADTDNISMKQARHLLEVVWATDKNIIVHNAAFEMPVLYLAEDEDGTKWSEHWKDNGYRGFVPKVLDSKISASYENENIRLGLKGRCLHHFGEEQTSYKETTTKKGVKGTLPSGGKVLREWEETPTEEGSTPVTYQERQYKMAELTGQEVTTYGAEDALVTAALQNYFRLVLELEHTWNTLIEVEVAATYANAFSFVGGIGFSMQRMMSCEAEDKASVSKAWPVLRDFLIGKGWEGTLPPVYTAAITAAEIKQAFEIVVGRPLETMVRTLSKLVTLIREVEEQPVFAGMLERLLAGDAEGFTKYVCDNFSGEPVFNSDSPVQMKKLMYETLALPVRLSNKVTDIQRSKGQNVGTAKTDDLAMQTAIHFDADKVDLSALKAIQILKQCGTRSKLFYEPYKNFPHHSDNLLHPSTNQCATVTRRNSASKPNYTQWPAKGEGIKFRECIVPRGLGRVIISSDSSGQELRLAADFSRDENMLSCYLGNNKRDIHSMVASSATKYFWDRQWTYDEFYSALKGDDEELAEKVDALRTKSKAVVFGEIYGSQAKSLSERLMITEQEAQSFLDAKKAQFPGVDKWKDSVVAKARKVGYSATKMGARRHLRDILVSGDKWEVSKAERQLSNHEIQSSGAESIKIALGKCFFSEVMHNADVYIIGSIHDEIVLDVPAEHAYKVGTELVKFMTAPYGEMIVPFISETTVGVDFGKQLKLPLGFTAQDMQARLDKLFKLK